MTSEPLLPHGAPGPGRSSSVPVWLIAVAVIAMLATTFTLALQGAQSTTRNDVADRFAERANLSAAFTSSVFSSSSSSGGEQNARRFGGATVSDAQLTTLMRQNRTENLVVLDARGGILAAAKGTPPGLLRTLRARPTWIRRVIAGRAYSLSGLLRYDGGPPVIEFVQPFKTRYGTRMVVSGFQPKVLAQFFAGYLSHVPSGSGGRAYVLDAAGTIVGSTRRDVRTGRPVDEPGLIAALRRAPRGSIGSSTYTSRMVDGTSLRVVLVSPTDSLFVSVSGTRKWLPWVIVAAFLLAAGLALWFLRRNQRSNADLRTIQERYALVVAASNDGLWDLDLVGDRLYLSPRWRAILGLPADTPASNEMWLDRVHPDDRERLQATTLAHLEGRTDTFEIEYRILHEDGEYRWVLVRGLAIRDARGTPTRMAGSMADITARKTAEEQLRRDALHDELTGLPNRALFHERLAMALRQARRDPEYRCAVLFLDLDRFKLINDSFSHSIGDELLVEVGRRLSGVLRPGDMVARADGKDMVARLGGDEFTVVLDDIGSLDAAVAVAERILEVLAEPFVLERRRIVTGASIGVALSSVGVTGAEMMRNADLAMYAAKRQGKSRVAVFSDDLHAEVAGRLDLEMELRAVIEEDALEVAYQPIVDLSDGSVTGFEALARWPGDRAAVSPDRFIPIAEETGLIAVLGRHVLHTACAQLAEWRRVGAVGPRATVSVNVSGMQFDEADVLYDDVVAALESSGLPADGLRLEITESTLVRDPERLSHSLDRFSQLGVVAHIDDFGTGYSSLTTLHHFPGDTLKIDRSFVSSMHVDDGHQEIVRAIISMAHNLGLRTVAEGIDHPRQLEILRDLGCEGGQGFLLARPAAAASITELLRVWPADAISAPPGAATLSV